MQPISISNLKTHLSATLKEVIKGIHYIVMDRDTPIAEIIPYDEGQILQIRPPIKKYLKKKSPVSKKLKLDVVEYLLQDRRGKKF